MAQHDWTQFTLRVNIHTEPQRIYDAWTTRTGLESWFLRQAVFFNPDGAQRPESEHFQKGDTYEWRWHGYPDEVVEKKEVLAANGENVLTFIFSGNCIVSVQITRESGEILVVLTQSHIPTDEASKISYYNGCSLGWTFYLANLKSVLEGGLDLRNKNLNLPSVVNA